MSPTPTVLDRLTRVVDERGAGYLVLVDPDSVDDAGAAALAEAAVDAGVDAFLVGGSLLMRDSLGRTVERLREASGLPTLLFPGGSTQLTPHADAILFLSLLSGRNPEFLVGEQVRAAPIIREYGLEAIPTAYLLIEGGVYTSVQFMSGTFPIPRDKTDIAMAHALTAQYLGMRLLYLEGGSGAKWSVPDDMIRCTRAYTDLPVIVGGGITKPETAAAKVRAGAHFVVTGNVLEGDGSAQLLQEFSSAVHQSAK
jgi:phosphoglycerol geranylgeranyltransferase